MRIKGVSSVANTWLNKVYKVLAITLVLFAVLISGLRIIFPYAQEYRQELQDHINSRFDSNIALGSITLEWKQDGPLLVAENVRLLKTEAANIFIKKIYFQLDFWGCIRYQRLQTKNLQLVGAKFYINSTLMDPSASPRGETSLINNTTEIFLEQITKFSLNDSQVILRHDNTSHTFNIEELRWLNYGENHKANGSVMIEGLTENTLNFKLDVVGDTVTDMRGQVYLEAINLDITPWLGSTLSIDDKKTDADINFQAWMEITNGLPKSMNISLDKSDISYQYNEEEHRLQILSGDIQVNNIDNSESLIIESNAIELFSENYAWQPFTFSFLRKEGEEFAYVSTLDLEGVEDLLPLFFSKNDAFSVVDQLSPKGQMTDLYIRQFGGTWQAASDFSNISTKYSDGLPSIENLSGSFVFSDDSFNVELLAEAGELDLGEHFKQALPYDTILAQVKGTSDENGWSLKFVDITVDSPELTLAADIGVELPINGEASMSLLATVKDVDAANIPHYYPHLLMGDNLVNYLEQGIVRGKLEQAVVLLNGPLNHFPFVDNSGVFEVNAELVESTFIFDSDWPAIQGFNANLNFIDNSMLITGRSGRIQGIKVKGVETGIADLSDEQILTVDAEFTDVISRNVSRLMNNSPMADTVGETLQELVVSGLLSGDFNLNLPLNALDDVVAKGTVKFENNLVNLQTPHMNFTELNGELSYRNDAVRADHLSMKWEGLPLILKVDAKDQSERYTTKLSINTLWQQKEWQPYLPVQLHKYIEGDFNFEGDLNLNMHHSGDFSYDFKVKSLLRGLALSLPEPYDKKAQDKKFLQAYASGNKVSTTLDVSVDNNLSFYGVLDHDSESFTKSHLVLGEDDILLPLEGFYITTKLGAIDFAQWQPFISDILDATASENLTDKNKLAASESDTATEAKKVLLPAPKKIRGEFKNVDAYGQNLTDVSFDLLDESSWWKLSLNAKEVRSEVKFYPDWIKEGVEVNADFIHLAWQAEPLTAKVTPVGNQPVAIEASKNSKKTVEKTNAAQKNTVAASSTVVKNPPVVKGSTIVEDEESSIDKDALFADMPKLKVNCASCKIGAGDLGKVSFDVVREGNDKIIVKDFKAKRDKSYLNLDLVWQHNNKQSNTHLYGDLRIEDVEQEIKRYGYPSTVRDSSAKVKYDLSWQDAPSHFVMKTFSGDVSVSLDEGYLAEVSDKARIFSVLSLQSLVRKLKLDFRDMFSDGMFYSEIKGDFSIKNGILYTKNTRMKGAAGDLNVKGNTDFNKELLNYHLSYKPNLTSSLPVLAWVATLNPVTFLAGVALNEVITSQVVSEINFELTGNIYDPVLVEVERKSKDVTVGQSSPPQIVDSAPLPKDKNKTKKNQSTAPINKDNEPQVNKFNG